ncbi:hypothetical protein FDG2_0058 [Candidatus Protofrankia californiensis]|uniref:Transposase IS30-like HTH domain-containing protein n=1 Tax=Candidatus Protofrankia californiensis TaxID=1839754 RepID=A0A1C3NSV0_9ACTN|nr:hypothetical protein FDG2_0058 [Candidatus Protofrankia californiensis]
MIILVSRTGWWIGRQEQLTIDERELIFRELSRNCSAWLSAKALGRHHSTISREIERNGGEKIYRAVEA